MRIKLGSIRRLVREELMMHARKPQLVTIDQLADIQNDLDDMLANGEMTLSDYEREWADTLQSLGWTPEMYEKEIDRRWDYVDRSRDVPVHGRNYGAN